MCLFSTQHSAHFIFDFFLIPCSLWSWSFESPARGFLLFSTQAWLYIVSSRSPDKGVVTSHNLIRRTPVIRAPWDNIHPLYSSSVCVDGFAYGSSPRSRAEMSEWSSLPLSSSGYISSMYVCKLTAALFRQLHTRLAMGAHLTP